MRSTREEEKIIMDKLSAPLPSEAIQRTKDKFTHKGYDTDGYGYQFCVNRFNEVLGRDWGYEWDVSNVKEGTTKNGATNYEFTINLGIWIFSRETIRRSAGGHISRTYFDANKGAFSNAFKKAAAMWGVGRHAYEGALDDDNDPYVTSDDRGSLESPCQAQNKTRQPVQATVNTSTQVPKDQPSSVPISNQAKQPSTPNAAAGIIRRIMAKMEMVCERSEEKVAAWILEQSGVDQTGLASLSVETLQSMLRIAEVAFDNWKAGK